MFKKIGGFNGFYDINEAGTVRSLYSGKYGIRDSPKTLRQVKSGRGYLKVNLYVNGVPHQRKIHRLVAENFIDNPLKKECVNHKDGNKLNNHVDNLEWCSRAENNRHAFNSGLMPVGEESYNSKLCKDDVLQIRSIYAQGWSTHSEISDAYNVDRRTIGNIVNNKTWRHLL